MPSPLIPFKRIISPPPISLQTYPFAIPIRRKQIRTNLPINHGPTSSHNKKRPLPKEEPQQAYIRKRTVPTPNRHTNQGGQKRSDCH